MRQVECGCLPAAALPEAAALAGYPPSDRLARWMQESGAIWLRQHSSKPYRHWLGQSASVQDARQIERDISRTDHRLGSTKEQCLRRVLRAHACRRRDIGYTQGLNIIVGVVLLLEAESSELEEAAFWLLGAITDRMLPDYFVPTLIGVRTDVKVLDALLREHPSLSDVLPRLEQDGIDINVVTTPWLMLAFANSLPPELTHRVWDLFFRVGSRALLATALALICLQAPYLRQASSFEQVWERFAQMQPLSKASRPCDGTLATPDAVTLMRAIARELRGLSVQHIAELRVEARRAEIEASSSDELRRVLAELQAHPVPHGSVVALASLGFYPALPDRWQRSAFLRAAMGLGTNSLIGEIHLLGEPSLAASAICSQIRRCNVHADDHHFGTRARLQRLRFRLRALHTTSRACGGSGN